MKNECPTPLVPPEADLTDFKFMPLEVARLINSEWWITACVEDPRRAVAAINLWSRSWHQRPAASIPNNDTVLATLALLPLNVWLEIKEAVLEPWTLCSDGRWYHPVVSEKANDAWEEKASYRARKEKWIESGRRGGLKRAEKAAVEATEKATVEASLQGTLEATLEAPLQPKERGIGRGRGINKRDKSLLSEAEAPDVPEKEPSEGYTAEFEDWWNAYPRKEGKGAAFRAYKNAKRRSPPQKLLEGAVGYSVARRGQDPRYTKTPAAWLNGDHWNDAPSNGPNRRILFPGYVPMAQNGG